MFELFDFHDSFRVTSSKLPHWYQPGVTYFVTFRTEDSLPRAVEEQWRRRRADWLLRNSIDPNDPRWRDELQRLPAIRQRQFHSEFSEQYLALLDKGHGACSLKRREIAKLVAETLLHFHGERYDLATFVVMPNHVHLLVGLRGDTDLLVQCRSWKKYSAIAINRALGRTGRFWQEGSFDHLVRSVGDFERFRQYIAENGSNAGLSDNDYLLWQNPICEVIEIAAEKGTYGTRSVPST